MMSFQNNFFLFPLLFSFVLSMILIPVFVRLAPRLRLLDRPGGRKIHQDPIPRVGGLTLSISILIAVLVVCAFCHLKNFSTDQMVKLGIILLGSLLAALLGLIDDLMDLRPLTKFGCQTLLSGFFAFWGYHFSFINIPGFSPIALSFFSVPFTAFWIMGVMNGFNFMDGVDGLAGSVSAVTLLGLGIAGFLQQDPSLWILAAAGLGGVAAFLAYNRPPAKIYLGDAGANVLGFLSAASLVALGQPKAAFFHSAGPTDLADPFRFRIIFATLIVGYPFLEVFLSTVRRGIKKFYFGRSMEWSEKEHIHHRLLKLGFEPMRISILGSAFNFLMVVAALWAMVHEYALAVFFLLPFIIVFTILMPRMGFFDFMGASALLGKRSYYLMAHNFMNMQQVKLKLVSDKDEILALVCQTCAEFGVQGFWIKSEADQSGEGGLVYYWERPHDIHREYLQFIKTEITSGDFEIFRERAALENEKIAAYWIFEPNTEENELDVEYRVLVSNFMHAVLHRIYDMGHFAVPDLMVQIGNLSHAKVRSSLLRRRYGETKTKTVPNH
jgi:UDP-GlcNAc:undecaprenyl-phosphate/decaprenyl-phosphate GlcNAc-1-phosphate transferase